MKKLLAITLLVAMLAITFTACNTEEGPAYEPKPTESPMSDPTEKYTKRPTEKQTNKIEDIVPTFPENNAPSTDSENIPEQSKPSCSEHRYVDNICSICNCSRWTGNKDTSWYSVTQTQLTISTAEQLAGLADLVNNGIDFHDVTILLGADIDLDNREWTPIGTDEDNGFVGSFNGQGYTISKLSISNESSEYVGLFGYSGGTLSNINLDSIAIYVSSSSGIRAGGLTGINDGEIKDCTVFGSITCYEDTYSILAGGLTGANYGSVDHCFANVDIIASNTGSSEYCGCTAGGLVGHNYKASINNSYAIGDVSGHAKAFCNYSDVSCSVGGLVGTSSSNNSGSSTISNCYATGRVNSSADNDACYVGGLIGGLTYGTTVENCYATGDITGISNFNDANTVRTSCAGGLIGYVYSYSSSLRLIVVDCWAAGNAVLETSNERGYAGSILVGYIATDAVFENCYYNIEQTLTATNSEKTGTPAQLSDFKGSALYFNRLLWDSSIWNFEEGEYPTLK